MKPIHLPLLVVTILNCVHGNFQFSSYNDDGPGAPHYPNPFNYRQRRTDWHWSSPSSSSSQISPSSSSVAYLPDRIYPVPVIATILAHKQDAAIRKRSKGSIRFDEDNVESESEWSSVEGYSDIDDTDNVIDRGGGKRRRKKKCENIYRFGKRVWCKVIRERNALANLPLPATATPLMLLYFGALLHKNKMEEKLPLLHSKMKDKKSEEEEDDEEVKEEKMKMARELMGIHSDILKLLSYTTTTFSHSLEGLDKLRLSLSSGQENKGNAVEVGLPTPIKDVGGYQDQTFRNHFVEKHKGVIKNLGNAVQIWRSNVQQRLRELN